MKNFSSDILQDHEILQLLILDILFSLPCSKDLVFQGGTCLRWVYNGTRYSEDLDFLARDFTVKNRNEIQRALGSDLRKRALVQFGPGELDLPEQWKERGTLHTLWVRYRHEGRRSKIGVKIEIQEAQWDRAKKTVLRQLPEVGRFLAGTTFRIPFGRSILQSAPAEEILAEKIKALVERPYIKGRDLYDIRFLRETLNLKIEPALVVERTRAYPGPFVPKRSLRDLHSSRAGKALRDALEELHRFVPPEEFGILKEEGYLRILDCLDNTIEELLAKGLDERILRQENNL